MRILWLLPRLVLRWFGPNPYRSRCPRCGLPAMGAYRSPFGPCYDVLGHHWNRRTREYQGHYREPFTL